MARDTTLTRLPRGGNTWSEPTPVPTLRSRSSFAPALLPLTDGVVFLTAENPESHHLYIARSSNFGGTFESQRAITGNDFCPGADPGGVAVAATDGKGRVFITFGGEKSAQPDGSYPGRCDVTFDPGIWFTSSTNGGKNFAAAREIAISGDQKAAFDPSIAVSSAGTVYVAYSTYEGTYLESSADGFDQQYPLAVPSPAGSSVDWAIAAVGPRRVLAVYDSVHYSSPTSVEFAQSTDGGKTFGDRRQLAASGDFPSIAANPDGQVALSWTFGGVNTALFNTDRNTLVAGSKLYAPTDGDGESFVRFVGPQRTQIVWAAYLPSTLIFYASGTLRTGLVPGAGPDFCNSKHTKNATGSSSHYRDVYACQNKNIGDEFGYQCTELSFRFERVVYGVPPPPEVIDGKDVVKYIAKQIRIAPDAPSSGHLPVPGMSSVCGEMASRIYTDIPRSSRRSPRNRAAVTMTSVSWMRTALLAERATSQSKAGSGAFHGSLHTLITSSSGPCKARRATETGYRYQETAAHRPPHAHHGTSKPGPRLLAAVLLGQVYVDR